MSKTDQPQSRRRAIEEYGADPEAPGIEIYNLRNLRHGGERTIIDTRGQGEGGSWVIRDSLHPGIEVTVRTQQDARIYARLDFGALEHLMDLAHLRGADAALTITVRRTAGTER